MHTAQLVEVKSLGEDVILSIGSWNCRLYFETAILLASWLDECARDAKLFTGNTWKLLRAYGTLHDASNKNWLNVGQPLTPGKVFPVSRDILKKHQIAVRQEGANVVFTAGTAAAVLPHSVALQISQWIRVRAKESQKRAGDMTRHWSAVTREHQTQYGPGVTRG